MEGFNKKIWIGLLALALLSPVGLLMPRILHSGKPWGEWSAETVAKDKGYMPQGMKKDANLYKAPITDYNLGKESDPFWKRSGSYILSGIIGIGVIALITYGMGKLAHKK